ncbi:MAG: site-specific tyrosine recombinase XerD [Clostridiales bacterium]|nr:site-specific tyrosine recombinase XerD [Clostridiales bacterium]
MKFVILKVHASGGFIMFIEEYADYLKIEKKKTKNTFDAYMGDLREFLKYLEEKGVPAVSCKNTEVVGYLLKLKEEGKSTATTNRKIASVRLYYKYLMERGLVAENPADNIKTVKVEKKGIEYLTIEEIDNLLSLPDDSLKGKRDRAILEVLYATGIRVSELVNVKVSDVNIRMGFVTLTGESSKARIVPLGRPARAALEEYIYDVRKGLVRDSEDDDSLFVNYHGKKLTRQGLWKIIKEYASKAGIENKITPQTLRHSFAVHMVQNGADLKSLQELLGHEDISATQIYLSVTKNRIKDVYDKTHPRA